MNRPVRQIPARRPQPNPWHRWAGRYGAPAAATALALAWLADTGSPGQGALVATLAIAAFMVFTSTMPATPRRATRATERKIRAARITVVDADPGDSTPSDAYEMQVHGVSVLVRLRTDPNGQPVPYVHVEHRARPRVLLVEIDNQGERIHP
ncbi:hypothetical protein [Kitasatospora sp. MBT63]|uniref:hypothetical protein n=1 Tax=Kitasatospora sp. MBT63 TaxID=1444768 RepID=UPI00053A0CD2|nr:hypothetical protein [Kitasatospora sp. MBT63]